MADKKTNRSRLLVDYRKLGTVSREELMHAIHDDLSIVDELFSVRFYTGAKLILFASDEFGNPRYFKDPFRSGGYVSWLNTCHYRPACLDYHL